MDPLLKQLRERYRDIDFVPATDPVVRGADLERSGNRAYGREIYVATRGAPDIDTGFLRAGASLAPGTREHHPRCSLVCEQRGSTVFVRVVDGEDQPLTRSLSTPAMGWPAYDEALFVWLGPVEDICTPWSDNDPPQCQVVTVERLRQFARDH